MSDTQACYDAVCPQCRRRLGWFGRFVDRPACRCGHRPAPEDLEREQARMDDFHRMLAELRAANPGWERWREARVAAGLTLRQAAKLLEVAPVTLSAIERGEQRPSEALAGRMARCYGA